MIRVEVTQADIDAGSRNDCTACPIALAMRRLLDSLNVSFHLIGVVPSSVAVYRILDNGLSQDMFHISLPTVAYNFIYNYDRFIEVKPFTFEIVDYSPFQPESFEYGAYGFIAAFNF